MLPASRKKKRFKMKIGQKFNRLTFKEYFFYIDNHEKYTDFNILGLYRSIIENKKLDLNQKIEVREYAHTIFRKSFEFLQLKDPKTYFDVITLGQEITKGYETRIWEEIRINQQKILSEKKIKHRNFGTYSKHNCGYENCHLNGLMLKKGSPYAYGYWGMSFYTDKNHFAAQQKSEKFKKERKNNKQTILKKLEGQ